MSLPNPSMSFSPFAILLAEEMNDIVENITALAAGTGLDSGAVTSSKIASATITSAQLVSNDGWVTANETITYASATTFTCSSELAALLQTGDKIKLTQTTVKYFYVVSKSGTTITITGGTDYTLANAAITLPYYSHEANPVGFPGAFAFTPTITAGSGTFTAASGVGRFSITGRRCFTVIAATITTIGTGSGCVATLPVSAASAAPVNNIMGACREDQNTGNAGIIKSNGNLTQMSFARYDNGNIVSGGSGSVIRGEGQYEI
jgi:hypothetical protein